MRATTAQESGASASLCGRGADCATARDPGRPGEAWSLRERTKNRKPEGRGSQREARVCRWPGAPINRGRAERPRFFAVAEPDARRPENRQSEQSDVCRDRAKGKYKMPEDGACRREAVVRRDPEAGREPHRGGRARVQSGRRGGAQPGPDGRWQPRGRAGENDAAGGAPSRKGATPRRDPGDCNAGRLPRRSLKRARRTSQAGCAQSMRRGKKTPREDQQGRCRAMGQRKGPATPLPECGRERCRRRDRAGAEECPGATPAYRLMGWRAGNPPPGDDREDTGKMQGA